jgi:nucleotide-binding universal stress UspA family protein
MEANQHRPYVIVVGVDYSESCARALKETFAMSARQPGAEPHVIHVGAPYGSMPDGFASVNVEQAAQQLQTYVNAQLAKFVDENPGAATFERVHTHQRLGAAADEIAELATDLDADLIVVGTHSRRGVERLLLGSVAERVVRIAPCPVVVVREKRPSTIPQIQPPCPNCVAERKKTNGQELWCQTHRERHVRGHAFHYVNRNSAESNHPLTVPLTRN